jgi:hypothetical protein
MRRGNALVTCYIYPLQTHEAILRSIFCRRTVAFDYTDTAHYF